MTDVRFIGDEAIFENFQGEEIDIADTDEITGDVINGNFDLYQGKKVIFRNCTNLKTIRADSLYLSGLEIENCPKLEYLSACNNRISKVNLSSLKNLKMVRLDFNKVLENIDLTGCENLRNLGVRDNKLRRLNLTSLTDNIKIPQLKELDCSYNKGLRILRVKHLKELEVLHCEGCNLVELFCNDLRKLKKLFCFDNVIFLDSGKMFGLKELDVSGCQALEILDCAENTLEELKLGNNSQLRNISAKTNSLEKLIINECPKLTHLDFSYQGIYEKRWVFDESQLLKLQVLNTMLEAMGINNISDLLKTMGIYRANEMLENFLGINNTEELLKSFCLEKIHTKIFIDNNFSPNLEKLTFTEGAIFFNLAGETIKPQDFPNLKIFTNGIADDPDFEEYINKNLQEEWEKNNLRDPDEGYYETNDDIPVCNYKIPAYKNIIDYHDISHRRLTGKLIIENWPNLKFLNVGDNRLQALVIRNCPNLRKLIYAHNAMPEVAEIENESCPKLQEIVNYLYDEFVDKTETPISEEEQAHIDAELAREQQEDEGYKSDEGIQEDIRKNSEKLLAFINNPNATVEELLSLSKELKLTNIETSLKEDFLNLAEQLLSSLTYEELGEISPDDVPNQLALIIIKLLTSKFKEQQEQQKEQEQQQEDNEEQNNELTTKITDLIKKSQAALKENNLKEVKNLLAELKTHTNTPAYEQNKELIAKLEKQLANANSHLQSPNQNTNLPLIIIGISVVSLGIVLLFAKFLQNKIKKMVKNILT